MAPEISQQVVVESAVPAVVAVDPSEVPASPPAGAPIFGRPAAEESWEAGLAARVAVEHAPKIPGRTPKEIAEQLLAKLLAKQKFRQVHNLNHWERYAPEYLLRLARWMIHERKKEIETFIQQNSVCAYSLALAVTDDPFRADWVVSDTNLELWEGRLREEYYFLALKRNALNFMEKLGKEQEVFLPLEGGFVREEEDEDEPLPADEVAAEPGPDLGWEQDPLTTLIKRDEEAAAEEQLALAMKIARRSRKYWWIRQKSWGRALGIRGRKGSKVSTNRAAHRITE